MCIGNLRSALQNVDDYILNHERGFLINALLYAGVIACFVLGAVLGMVARVLGAAVHRYLTLLLFVAFGIMFIDCEHPGDRSHRPPCGHRDHAAKRQPGQ